MKPTFITKRAFIAYLKAHPRMRFKARSWSNCPLARAMNCNVDATYAWVDDELVSTPTWASDFIRKVDSPGKSAVVTSQAALELLSKVAA